MRDVPTTQTEQAYELNRAVVTELAQYVQAHSSECPIGGRSIGCVGNKVRDSMVDLSPDDLVDLAATAICMYMAVLEDRNYQMGRVAKWWAVTNAVQRWAHNPTAEEAKRLGDEICIATGQRTSWDATTWSSVNEIRP